MADPRITALIVRGARQRGLDPEAVLAVASTEGLGGGVGDGGHAFGPFQLNDAGGVLTGRPGNHRAFAESPAGINFALDRIAGVARGLRGRAAITAIVRGFERPRRPGAEISKASARYGHMGSSLAAAGNPLPRQLDTQPPSLGRPGVDIGGVLNLTRSIVGLPESSISLIPPPVAKVPRPYTRAAAQPKVDMTAGFKHKTGRTINFLQAYAKPFGVQVTSTTHGNHVKGSYHYRGRAVDFGGGPAQMAALARAALSHPQDFTEMFYTGPGHPGSYIKNGKAYPLSSLDRSVYDNHHDHVHLAR
jgi:hypothetical protein